MHNALIARDAPFPGEKCARELQLPNWEVIRDCANSTEGSKLLQDSGVRTQQLNPPLSNVPTITFNHVSICGQKMLFECRISEVWRQKMKMDKFTFHPAKCLFCQHFSYVYFFNCIYLMLVLVFLPTANRRWFDGSWIERFTNCIVSCYAWAKTIRMPSIQCSRPHRYRHIFHYLCHSHIDWPFEITLKKMHGVCSDLERLNFSSRKFSNVFRIVPTIEFTNSNGSKCSTFSVFSFVVVPHSFNYAIPMGFYVNKLIEIIRNEMWNEKMCAMIKWCCFLFLIRTFVYVLEYY